MIWLFVSIVLLLLVFHAGFRKFALWFGGIAGAVGAIALAVGWWNEMQPKNTGAAPDFDLTTALAACKAWQHPAKDNITGVQSCYDPHDATQLTEHLKECAAPKPGDPYYPSRTVADRRGIPCNTYDQFDNDCPAPPATPWPGCVSREPEPWSKYPKATAKTPVTASAKLSAK
ncbi:MAG: hypothetical protein WAK94_04535 [Steroidobacteraceae bacterium]